MIRVWEQGLVATFSIEGYRELIDAHYAPYKHPDTVIEIHGLSDHTSEAALAIAGRAVNHLGLYQQQESIVARRILAAEKAGFDAAIIGVMQDPGLEVARSLCSIPVLAYGETSMHIACMVGQRFAFIAINPPMVTVLDRQIRARGLKDRAGDTVIMDCGYPALEEAVRGRSEEFLKAFTAAARAAVKDGVDVLIPGQTILSEVLWREGITEIDGAMVLDVRPYLIALAEAQARLRQMGLPVQPSSGFLYGRPDEGLVQSFETYLGEM